MSPDGILLFLEIVAVILFGLSFGSFATVLAHRGHVFSACGQGELRARLCSRSCCPRCGTRLGIADLVPVFSWFVQKGRCRYCSKPVSPLYPAMEITVLLMGLGYFWVHGFLPVSKMLTAYAAFSILAGLFVFDLKFKILPNGLVAALGVTGLFYRFWPMHFEGHYGDQLWEYIGGVFFYAAFAFFLGWLMEKILGRPALGMGDVKFFGVAGLWLGISNIDAFCILSGIFGVVLGIAWKKLKKEDAFPFGPALIASFFVLLLLDGSHLL